MRLSAATIDRLTKGVARPGYDHMAQRRRIVHLGIGAFHRAHQAIYTDDAMAAGDGGWGITGVSLRSADVRDQLVPQNGLYTVTERGEGAASARLIGAVHDVIVVPEAPNAAIAALADPQTVIVTLTVTEKGYCRHADGNVDQDAIRALDSLAPRSIYGLLTAAFRQRKAAGLPGLTLVSCDNLAENGAVLARLLAEWLDHAAPDLANWFAAECACPSTMVDRIVPSMTDADRAAIADAIGLDDAGAVVTEPFRQWVIEDRFAGPRPRWEAGGAQFVTDVRPYEAAKLRMLNGAHSALAYLGLAAGHEFVHQAIVDPAIRPLAERLMRCEAAASLTPGPDQDLAAYADRLLARFGNHVLPHRLAQIAMDGSQKIGPRWLEPLTINRAAARACDATLAALAAWIVHARGDACPVDDPMADRLATLWRETGVAGIVPALFGERGLFASGWSASHDDLAHLETLVAQAMKNASSPVN